MCSIDRFNSRYCTNQFRSSFFIRIKFSLCNPCLLSLFKNQNQTHINTNSCKLFIIWILTLEFIITSISNLHHASFHLEIGQFYILYINGKHFLFVLFWSQLKFLCVQNERNVWHPYTKVHGTRNIRSEMLVIFLFFCKLLDPCTNFHFQPLVCHWTFQMPEFLPLRFLTE